MEVFSSLEIKSIDSARFMASSLSNLVNNTAKRIHKIECKIFYLFPKYESVKNSLIKYKWISYNKYYSNKLDEKFKKWKNTFMFSYNDINKLILLLKKLFTFMSTRMISKSLMKQHYLKKKDFIATWIWMILQMQITCMWKVFVKKLRWISWFLS